MNQAPQQPDLERFQQEVEYAVDYKVRNLRPGRWPARGRYGEGFIFQKFERLSYYPDFRRLDLLATARNPLANEPLVRLSKPSASIEVLMLADFSLSLACGFFESKFAQMAKLATLFGYTAFRYADRFGFLAFDERVLPQFYHPPFLSKTQGLEIGREILKFRPSAPFRGGPLDLEPYLPGRKSLILLTSDFYFSPAALEGILKALMRHRILPIMLRQVRERRWPPGVWGALKLRDAEDGREKAVFLSPGMAKRFARQARENEKRIQGVFRSLGTSPILLEEIDPEKILEQLTNQ